MVHQIFNWPNWYSIFSVHIHYSICRKIGLKKQQIACYLQNWLNPKKLKVLLENIQNCYQKKDSKYNQFLLLLLIAYHNLSFFLTLHYTGYFGMRWTRVEVIYIHIHLKSYPFKDIHPSYWLLLRILSSHWLRRVDIFKWITF